MQSPEHYVPGLLVRYRGATDTRGSRWVATLTRGAGPDWKLSATVPYQSGPDAAAAAVVAQFNVKHSTSWRVDPTALSLDGGDLYAYGCLCN
jgi:hypothetical protein